VSLHIFAAVVTPHGTAANNRGENEGNITTLQKLIWQGQPHSSVSAEAIRFALRRLLAAQEPERGTNRRFDEATRANTWQEADFASWASDSGQTYIDDDLLGFMSAEAAREEAETSQPEPEPAAEEPPEEEDGEPKKKVKKKPKPPRKKGKATVRRSVLEVTRAISLSPWPGDVTFNAASPGATPSAAKQGLNPVPYGAEVHATRYQFGLAMTPERLHVKDRAAKALHAIAQLAHVAGNHGRFLFDFAPDAVVLRLTHDPAPRLLYCFETADHGKTVEVPDLVRRVSDGDIKPEELILGGSIVGTATGQELARLGAHVPTPTGSTAAFEELIRRVSASLAERS
jgi:CRISPR-associated protein Cst2